MAPQRRQCSFPESFLWSFTLSIFIFKGHLETGVASHLPSLVPLGYSLLQGPCWLKYAHWSCPRDRMCLWTCPTMGTGVIFSGITWSWTKGYLKPSCLVLYLCIFSSAMSLLLNTLEAISIFWKGSFPALLSIFRASSCSLECSKRWKRYLPLLSLLSPSHSRRYFWKTFS